MKRKLSEEDRNKVKKAFSEKLFKFDKTYLDKSNWNISFGFLIQEYFPEYGGKGIYIPFTQIDELRELGEELIRIQESPLAKALK